MKTRINVKRHIRRTKSKATQVKKHSRTTSKEWTLIGSTKDSEFWWDNKYQNVQIKVVEFDWGWTVVMQKVGRDVENLKTHLTKQEALKYAKNYIATTHYMPPIRELRIGEVGTGIQRTGLGDGSYFAVYKYNGTWMHRKSSSKKMAQRFISLIQTQEDINKNF
jgi:hypothetical protein